MLVAKDNSSSCGENHRRKLLSAFLLLLFIFYIFFLIVLILPPPPPPPPPFFMSASASLISQVNSLQFKTVSMRSKKSINALHLVSGVGRSVPSQANSTWYLYGPESLHALHPVRRVRSCDPSFVFETVPRFIRFGDPFSSLWAFTTSG